MTTYKPYGVQELQALLQRAREAGRFCYDQRPARLWFSYRLSELEQNSGDRFDEFDCYSGTGCNIG